MIKNLQEEFDVYALDIIGFGLSSRPQIYLKENEEIIQLFNKSLTLWLKEMKLHDKEIYLAGHSFGGYLSGNFFIHNQKQIKKLILLSPAGVRKCSEEENRDRLV